MLVADLPTAFAQLSEYEAVPVADGVTVFEPLAASAPLQPPEAVQPVALMADQLSVVERPTVTVLTARLKWAHPAGTARARHPSG